MASGAATMHRADDGRHRAGAGRPGPGRRSRICCAHAPGWGAGIDRGRAGARSIAGSDLLPLPGRRARRTTPPLTRRAAGRPARVRAGAGARRQPRPPGLDRALPQPGAHPHPRRRHGGQRHAPDRSDRRRQRRVHQEPARRHPDLSRAAGLPDRAPRHRRRRLATAERMARWTADALGATPQDQRPPRPPGGARRRGLRHQHDPGRRSAGDADRLRRPGPVRAALHDRRHDRGRRRVPRAPDDPRRPGHRP